MYTSTSVKDATVSQNDIDYYRIPVSTKGGVLTIKGTTSAPINFRIMNTGNVAVSQNYSAQKGAFSQSFTIPKSTVANACRCRYIIFSAPAGDCVTYSFDYVYTENRNIVGDTTVVVKLVDAERISKIETREVNADPLTITGPTGLCPSEWYVYSTNRSCEWYVTTLHEDATEYIGYGSSFKIKFSRPDVMILCVDPNQGCTPASLSVSFTDNCSGNSWDDPARALNLPLQTSCEFATTMHTYGTNYASNNATNCGGVAMTRDVWARVSIPSGQSNIQITLNSPVTARAVFYLSNSSDGSSLVLQTTCLLNGSTTLYKVEGYSYLFVQVSTNSESGFTLCAVDTYNNFPVTNGNTCDIVPKNITVAATGNNFNLAIGWDAIPGATEYILGYTSLATGARDQKTVYTNSSTLTGLNNYSYLIDIRARVNGVLSGYAARSYGAVGATFSCAPISATMTGGSSSVTVNWTSGGVNTFKINLISENEENAIERETNITSTTVRSTTFSNLPTGWYRAVVRKACSSTQYSPVSNCPRVFVGTACTVGSTTPLLTRRGYKYLRMQYAAYSDVRWRSVGSSTWSVGTYSDASEVRFENLTPNTMYEFQFRKYCSCDNISAWTGSYTATTLATKANINVNIVQANPYSVNNGQSSSVLVRITNTGNAVSDGGNLEIGVSSSRNLVGITTRGILDQSSILSVPPIQPGQELTYNASVLADNSRPFAIGRIVPFGSDEIASDNVNSAQFYFINSYISTCNAVTPQISITPKPCEGVAVVTANSGNSLIWSDGNENSSNTVLSGNYAVTITDANGCNASATIGVSLPDQLQTKIVVDQTSVCDPVTKLSAMLAGGTAPYAISWNTGQTLQSIVPAPDNTYAVTVSDKNGCVSSSLFTGFPEALRAIKVLDHVEAAGGTAPYTFLWNNGSNNPLIPNGKVNHFVTVTDGNDCAWSGVFEGFGPLAIDPKTGKDSTVITKSYDFVRELSIFPNPASESFKLTLGAKDEGTVQILDMSGRLHASMSVVSGENTIPVDKLSVGMYICKFTNVLNDNVIFGRIVVVH